MVRKTVLGALILAISLNVPLSGCSPAPAPMVDQPTSGLPAPPTKEVGQTPTREAPSQPTQEADPTAEAFVSTYGIAASFTNDPHFGAIAVHENGERLVAMTEADSSGNVANVTGAVWFSPNGDSCVVFRGADGLPDRAVFADYLALFSNYTSDSVDITLIAPDGWTQVATGVQIDPAQASELMAYSSRGAGVAAPKRAAYSSGGLTLGEALRVAQVLVGLTACATALAGSAGLLTAAVLLPCGGLIITAINLALPEANPALAGTGAFLSAVGCATGGAGCISWLVGAASAAVTYAETVVSPRTPIPVPTATSVLPTTGTGVVVGLHSWVFEVDDGQAHPCLVSMPGGLPSPEELCGKTVTAARVILDGYWGTEIQCVTATAAEGGRFRFDNVPTGISLYVDGGYSCGSRCPGAQDDEDRSLFGFCSLDGSRLFTLGPGETIDVGDVNNQIISCR